MVVVTVLLVANAQTSPTSVRPGVCRHAHQCRPPFANTRNRKRTLAQMGPHPLSAVGRPAAFTNPMYMLLRIGGASRWPSTPFPSSHGVIRNRRSDSDLPPAPPPLPPLPPPPLPRPLPPPLPAARCPHNSSCMLIDAYSRRTVTSLSVSAIAAISSSSSSRLSWYSCGVRTTCAKSRTISRSACCLMSDTPIRSLASRICSTLSLLMWCSRLYLQKVCSR